MKNTKNLVGKFKTITFPNEVEQHNATPYTIKTIVYAIIWYFV